MSNPTRQLRFGTTYTVDFPDFPSFTAQPTSMKITQDQGKHDMLELSFPTLNPSFVKLLKTGALVRVKWRTSRANNEFVGHVYNVSPLTQSTQTRNLIVTCTGAGFNLKEGGAKVWTNKTAPEIITDICKTAKLKPIVTQHTVRFSQQSLIGQTMWEKAQELANRIGYVCHVFGTELHFHPIDKMIDAHISNVPVLSFQDSFFGAFNSLEGQTLDKFRAIVGDLFETGGSSRKDKVVSGIDSVTGKSFSYSASPKTAGKKMRATISESLFQEVIPTRVTGSPSEAKAMAEAFAQHAKFSVHGEAHAQGDPRIAPYKTVEINGTGEHTDGFWVVKRAVHSIFADGRYVTEFTCMTDGVGQNKSDAIRPTTTVTASGTRNIPIENVTGIKVSRNPAKISSPSVMVNQTNAGYKVFPRKWIG